jgi:hypothetical protein
MRAQVSNMIDRKIGLERATLVELVSQLGVLWIMRLGVLVVEMFCAGDKLWIRLPLQMLRRTIKDEDR